MARHAGPRWMEAGRALRGAEFKVGEDGEIKGPGPFGSKALVVLENFRDPLDATGPGNPRSLSDSSCLSGTLGPERRYA